MSSVDELAGELRGKYSNAAKSQKVVEIHLFGIRHAEALKTVSLPALLDAAGMPNSYKTELRKGIRLAPFVALKS